jgi:hypothetical protein
MVDLPVPTLPLGHKQPRSGNAIGERYQEFQEGAMIAKGG